MEIKKSHIITFSIAIVLCIITFCAGIFFRFRGVSGTSQQLVDGIVLERETADRIADELNLGKVPLQSSNGYGQAILEGIGSLRKSSEVGRICVDVISQSIKDDQEFTSTIQGNVLGYIDTTDYALELAIRRAESYESIVRAYEQAQSNIGEDNQESK